MRKSKLWKAWEREVAEWFGTKRNPLSGGNNYNDDGEKRVGDILLRDVVVEVKLRSNHSVVARAMKTAENANTKPWIHIERASGNKKIVVIALPVADAKAVVKYWYEKVVRGEGDGEVSV